MFCVGNKLSPTRHNHGSYILLKAKVLTLLYKQYCFFVNEFHWIWGGNTATAFAKYDEYNAYKACVRCPDNGGLRSRARNPPA